MNDFQEQAKNWLRNVVKQNPDKIKAGVEKAGDLIDKQTGGKYAEKVDAVQQKVGGFVDKQTDDANPSASTSGSATERTETTGAPGSPAEPPVEGASGRESDEVTTEPVSADSPAGTQPGGPVREP